MRINMNGERIRIKRGQSAKTVDGKLVVQNKIAKERTAKPCEVCKEDMFVAEGQVANYHGKCRAQRKLAK